MRFRFELLRNKFHLFHIIEQRYSELLMALDSLVIPVPVPPAHVRTRPRIRAMGEYPIPGVCPPQVVTL